MDPALLAEVAAHDAAVARRDLELWIGAEPTFTDRRSQEPWWLGQAEGGDKEDRARALLLALAPRLPGPVRLLRARGRHYPGEAAPRFCLGALHRRELLLEVSGASRIELLLVKRLGALVARLVLIVCRHGIELGDRLLDALALAREKLTGSLGVHGRRVSPLRRRA
jgi:hypothetical protein